MLQFLYPIGLFAAAGIIIPVIVHLWNIKNGKTLQIGSIALLGDPANQRSSNLKITDWPLLLLRCLLILLIALLMAGPLYRAVLPASKRAGWVLLEKQRLPELWKKNKKQLDSLLKKGYELRDFHTGFSPLDLKDTGTVFSTPAAAPLSYFSLIRQLDTVLDPGTSVFLYTDNRLNRFSGAQPITHLLLRWNFISPTGDSTSWTAANHQLRNGKISKLVAHSTLEGSYYQAEAAQSDTETPAPAAVSGSRLPADLQVLLFEDKQHADAAYVKAAVLAIADFTQRKISVKSIRSFSQISKEAQLVFWLTERPLSIAQRNKLPRGISFFEYAGTKPQKLKSVVHDEEGIGSQEAALYQRNLFDGPTANTLWTDGYAEPLLTLDTTAGIRHYRFYSRFNQNWTDLVWSNGLVKALIPLVVPDAIGFQEDPRSIRTYGTVPPVLTQQKGPIKLAAISYSQQALTPFIWWLVLLVFLIERLISYKKIAAKA